jgi:hypothetical protein
MATCPNINLPQWKELVASRGENMAYFLWDTYNGEVPQSESKQAILRASIKSIDILSSQKAKQMFAKGEKNNWTLDKTLTELQVPKAQKEIILDKGITNREEIITSLLAENSFIVEIDKKDTPTKYYSNLTVPGGTNYTENEITTPDITPSIKGHAQFSTDKGIGWFRSDEQTFLEDSIILDEEDPFLDQGDRNPRTIKSPTGRTNTRRILEVQSDLFQRGRGKKDLITNKQVPYERFVHVETGIEYTREETYDLARQEQYKLKGILPDVKDKNTKNQFLQLLNKKNNWVTFFVKSIIQDSAKKGYERVLFPKGNTASKIEGHNTLEEFNKQKKER